MSDTAPRQPSVAVRLWRRNLVVWAALLVLLALTVGFAYVPLGPLNSAIGIGIAATKAAVVVLLFMELWGSRPLLRLTAAAGLAFAVILFGLTLTDVLPRVKRGWIGLSPPTGPAEGAPESRRTGSQP